MTKQNYRELLRIAKEFIKLNAYIKSYNLPQSAISRFTTDNNYDMIGDKTLDKLCEEIYNSCILYKDIYEEYKNIA